MNENPGGPADGSLSPIQPPIEPSIPASIPASIPVPIPASNGQARAGYRERLIPGPGSWTILVGLGIGLGLIVLPIGAEVGWVVGIVAIVALITLGWTAAGVVQVTGGQLTAGRAVIDLGFVREVDTLDAEAMRVARGTGLDARAFLCLRGWINTGVRVRIEDPDDPTPYWLISTRHPQRLADALRQP